MTRRTLKVSGGLIIVAAALLLLAPRAAMAFGSYGDQFNSTYPGSASHTNAGCNLCHVAGGGTDLNGYGAAFAAGHNFAAIQDVDSDGDGTTNIAEITASAQPGWRPGPTNTFFDVSNPASPTLTGQNPPSITGNLDPPAAPVNHAPVANAGPDQAVAVAQTVQLDGRGSSDPDPGTTLTYAWTLSKPAGSAAALSSAAAVQPTFVADVPGDYTAQLTVGDGALSSAADAVVVTAAPASNLPPVANAGPDQPVAAGQTVTLNGSASTDPEAQPLTYAWSFVSKPAGSAAALSNTAVVQPTFTADAAGSYTVQLIVNDGTQDSPADTVVISAAAGNVAPTANAGQDQAVGVGQTVTLNGSGSTDPEGSPLTYAWSFVSKPAGSAATLSDPAAVQPTFVADVVGDYVVGLVVSDGTLSSTNPANATITAQSPVGGGLPGGSGDLGITRFRATREVELRERKPVRLRLAVRNVGQAAGDAAVTLVGVQNGAEVYRQTMTLGAPAGQKASAKFPDYRPTAAGDIAWTVTIQDQTPDNNSASAVTKVTGRDRKHDRRHDRDRERDTPHGEQEDDD